jgi:hypothetical protein
MFKVTVPVRCSAKPRFWHSVPILPRPIVNLHRWKGYKAVASRKEVEFHFISVASNWPICRLNFVSLLSQARNPRDSDGGFDGEGIDDSVTIVEIHERRVWNGKVAGSDPLHSFHALPAESIRQLSKIHERRMRLRYLEVRR